MESMELSLDDIIKAKKPTFPKKVNGKPGFRPRTNTHPAPTFRKPQLEDARSKIIQKNRAKIHDVRDLISAKKRPADARYVITKNMSQRIGKMEMAGAGPMPLNRRPHRPAAIPDPYMLDDLALDDLIPLKYNPSKLQRPKQYTSHAASYDYEPFPRPPPMRRSYVDYDAIEDTQPLHGRAPPEFDALFKEYLSTKQGGSSVPAAPLPRYKTSVEEDVFDLYEAPSRDRRPLPPPPSSSSSNQRRFIPTQDTHLSYEMQSRLEGSSRGESKSMGIFANPTKTLSGGGGGTSSRGSSPKGFRVMVTNLHSSVTVWDIQELFADIGGLVSAAIIKPGVAEVVYRTLKDAEDAVEVYHNRQLDGQPMKCHLITPPPPATMELDLDTLHSALFTSKRH